MSILDNIHVITPEMIILITASLTLLTGLFLGKKSLIPLIIALIGLILTVIVSYLSLGHFKTLILGGLYISDDIGLLMKMFICLTMGVSLVYVQQYNADRDISSTDFYVLALFSTLGMMLLVSAHSMLTIYLGLELFSLPLYALVAMQRAKADATEGAIKYFIMGSVASAMLLYGLSLIYGATGQLDLSQVAQAVLLNWEDKHTMLAFALVFILGGIGFKLASVPFHLWAPDVYQGAPSSVALLISAAPKIAAVGMALRMLILGLPHMIVQWQQIILIMAVLSTILGNVLAIVQTNIKRLLAYSAISHGGYALFGILSGTELGYAAALYYALIYAVMSVAAFGLIVLLSKKDFELENIDDLKGLNKRNPWLAFLMMIVMFSLAGVPPTVGFFAKLMVIQALIAANFIGVAVIGLVFAVVGAYYYIRIIKVMYFDDAIDAAPIRISPLSNVVYSLNCLALLYLGFFPAILINACMNALA